jgi:hypothetical protein
MVKSRVSSRGRRGGKAITKHRGGTKRGGTKRGGTKRRRTKRRRTKRRKIMRGGYGPGANTVGYAYDGGNVGTWPGVYSSLLGGNTNGMSMSNYYPLSPNGIPAGANFLPISTNNVYPVQTGGAPLWLSKILPSEVLNSTRLITGGLGNAYNSYVGQQTNASPLPQYQPIDQTQVPIVANIPNVPLIHLQAGQAAANI